MGIQSLAEDSITVCSKTPAVIENIYHKLQNFCNRKCSCIIELSSSVLRLALKEVMRALILEDIRTQDNHPYKYSGLTFLKQYLFWEQHYPQKDCLDLKRQSKRIRLVVIKIFNHSWFPVIVNHQLSHFMRASLIAQLVKNLPAMK